MLELVIIRGLPGSGKSTLAKTKYAAFNHFEADMWFMRNDSYVFDPKQIRDAHDWCQKQVVASLLEGKKTVVSNTFVAMWEIQIYLNIAKAMQAEVKIVTCIGNYKNVHSVPDSVIERMRSRWEEYYEHTPFVE